MWNRFTGCRFMTVKNRFISDARSCQPERSSVDSWFWSWRFIDRCHYRLWECSLAYLVSLAIETCLGSPICPDIPDGTSCKLEQTVSLSTAWKCGNVQQLFSALVQPRIRTFHKPPRFRCLNLSRFHCRPSESHPDNGWIRDYHGLFIFTWSLIHVLSHGTYRL